MATSPRVVSSTGVAVSGRRHKRTAAVKRAMENAILSCTQQGVTDPDQIRRRVLAARTLMRAQFNSTDANELLPE